MFCNTLRTELCQSLKGRKRVQELYISHKENSI